MSADATNTIVCANCGAGNRPEAAECVQCGKPLAKSDYDALNQQVERQNEAGLREARREVEEADRYG